MYCLTCGIKETPTIILTGHECRNTNYKTFMQTFIVKLKENIYKQSGTYHVYSERDIIENLRIALLYKKKLNITPTVRRTCLELGIEPNIKKVRDYVKG